ncbi:hypothetical protein SAMN02745206_03599 [Desulfacinum infernum DSM 9756]|uniref:Uncharacterized protein n=1 Tax=Desulfacinum infernum DSM 9756 TaxID=1121391 RepID=A0A1M5IH09_9BACT|nr:hypothetical protein SAMN02745206_03599 [Desulfacinum infernum DSM 9756]
MMSKYEIHRAIQERVLEECEEKGHPAFDVMTRCLPAFYTHVINPPSHADWLLSSHIKEIASRFEQVSWPTTDKAIEDTFLPPTRAEILAILSEASYRAPLTYEAMAIMSNTLVEVCEEEGIKQDAITRESLSEFERLELLDRLKRSGVGKPRVAALREMNRQMKREIAAEKKKRKPAMAVGM